MWVELSCSSPRLAQSCEHSSEMVHSRTGYLGTNVLWAQPTWDRQAGLPALRYALPSAAVAHHPSAPNWFLHCSEVRVKSSSPGPLGPGSFPSAERGKKVPAV